MIDPIPNRPKAFHHVCDLHLADVHSPGVFNKHFKRLRGYRIRGQFVDETEEIGYPKTFLRLESYGPYQFSIVQWYGDNYNRLWRVEEFRCHYDHRDTLWYRAEYSIGPYWHKANITCGFWVLGIYAWHPDMEPEQFPATSPGLAV